MSSVKLDDTQHKFTPDAGTVAGPVHCGVCGTEMLCTRSLHGSRTANEAMARYHSDYDSFECPHGKDVWHKQIVALRNLADDTCSAVFATMLRKEAEQILQTKTATKTTGRWLYL